MRQAGSKQSSGVSSEADLEACTCSAGNCDIKNLSRGSKVACPCRRRLACFWPCCRSSCPVYSTSCVGTSGALRPVCNRGVAFWSQVYLPVFVEGGKLSVGDMHFSQGDGEVSFCGAPPACNAAPHAFIPGTLSPEP